MSSLRTERVRELLKRTLSEILRREISIEEAGLLSVNEVVVSADLQQARVFVGVVGNAQQKKRAESLLESNRKRIQGLVGQAVVLRYTPVLKFVIDESIVQGNRVLDIIDEIEKSESGSTGPAK